MLKNSVFECEFKFQHVETLRKCTLCETNSGLIVSLACPLRAITPGQYAVFYKDNECLGSARISNNGPSVYFAYKYKIKYNKTSNDTDYDPIKQVDNINLRNGDDDVNEEIQIESVL